MQAAKEICQRVVTNIEKVIRGQFSAIRKIIGTFASGGHILIEDYPGTGKTTLAKSLAKSMAVEFKRIQFTPDLLPSDILGVSIFNQKDQSFAFHEGPVFTNVLLADEINRASPRTQSALLEAMAESQVSIDGQLRPLEEPFFVIATQNPVETSGTYPLPEAQMDRFALRFSLGYVPLEEEMEVLADQRQSHPIKDLESCISKEDVLQLRNQVKQVRISDELREYAVKIVRATRSAEHVSMGASPRASLALMKTAQALALFDGSEFVTPEHIQEIAVPVIAHRLVLNPQARFSGLTAEQLVEDIAKQIAVPA
ncbi:MAG: MoxR family ATPase [Desulfobacterales bacterium]|jgi:MoxR-like ATPase